MYNSPKSFVSGDLRPILAKRGRKPRKLLKKKSLRAKLPIPSRPRSPEDHTSHRKQRTCRFPKKPKIDHFDPLGARFPEIPGNASVSRLKSVGYKGCSGNGESHSGH